MTKIFKVSIFILFAFLLSSNALFSQTNFWERTGGVDDDIYSITITSNGNIWAGGTAGRVYLSSDNGNTWSSFNPARSYTVYSIGVNPVNGYIFAGTSGGLYRSTNNGVNWENVYSGYVLDIFFTQFGEIYLGIYSSGGVRYSTDMGNTWIYKNNGLPASLSGSEAYIRCLAQGTDGTLYAGTSARGIYRSTNGGDNWMISSNYTTASMNSFGMGITSASDGSVYAATYSNGVLKSTDKGITWNQVNTGLSSSSGDHQHIVYNPKTGHIFVSDNSAGVYRSTDLGTKWYKVHNGLPSNPVVYAPALAINPTTGMLFVGYATSIRPSIYRSTESIMSIININATPTSIDFGTLQAQTNKSNDVYITNTGETDIVTTGSNITGTDASSFLYVFTGAVTLKPNETHRLSVVFRPYTDGTKTATIEFTTDCGSADIITLIGNATPISVEEIEEMPTTYSLMQNYPNPFNPTTKIQYLLPEAAYVRLSVYNTMGQEVMQLLNENQPAGKYTVDFDAQNLQSGVYFYRLQTNKFVDTKKMLLLK